MVIPRKHRTKTLSKHPPILMDEAESVPQRDDFRVGIICAVGVEGGAVERQFDKKWRTEQLGRHPHDINVYSIGQIGTTLVVLVWLPGYGKPKASTAAVHLRYSYPSIEHVLVVGICGGVPVPKEVPEILLGDVVISTKIKVYD
jgi:nucleoside phosphorylase